MNIALWVVQVLLGLMFIAAGYPHAFRFESFARRPRMGWAVDVGKRNMQVIGLLEIAGGIGVIAPAATGILPWLTPLAAAGLALIMLFAGIFHARRGEPIIANAVLFAIAAFVAAGRTFIEPL